MKLSMWILKDWLSQYAPEPKINSGDMILRSARILSSNTDIEKENVYLARAGEFISGEEDRVIAVQGRDMLLLNTDNIDDVLNDMFDAFDFYNDWEDGLKEDIASGRDISALLQRSREIFGQPIVIYDSGNRAIALSDTSGEPFDEEWAALISTGANSLEFLEGMRQNLKLLRQSRGIKRFHVPGIKYSSVYRSLYNQDAFVGRLLLLEVTDSLTQGQIQLFEVFGEYVQRWMAESDTYLMSRSETEVFKDLLEDKDVSREEADRKLELIGWEKEDKKKLLRIEIPEGDEELTKPFFGRLERALLNEYCLLFPSCIFILANLEMTPEESIKEKLSSLLYVGSCCAVESYVFTDIFDMGSCSEQCRLVYEYTPKERGKIYSCSDYASVCIKSLMKSHIPKALAHPAIGILQDYDKANKSELARTLYEYLKNSCSTSKTAALLNLHRNSLSYRLGQIRELTGIDMENPEEREYLLLSFNL